MLRSSLPRSLFLAGTSSVILQACAETTGSGLITPGGASRSTKTACAGNAETCPPRPTPPPTNVNRLQTNTGTVGTASYNDLSNVSVKAVTSSNSTQMSGSAQFNASQSGGGTIQHQYAIIGGAQSNANYYMPATSPGQQFQVNDASGLTTTVSSSSSVVSVSATCVDKNGISWTFTVTNSDGQNFTLSWSSSQASGSIVLTLPNALACTNPLHKSHLSKGTISLAYAPRHASDLNRLIEGVELATLMCCNCYSYAALTAAGIAVAIGLATFPVSLLVAEGAAILTGLGSGVGVFGLALEFRAHFAGC